MYPTYWQISRWAAGWSNYKSVMAKGLTSGGLSRNQYLLSHRIVRSVKYKAISSNGNSCTPPTEKLWFEGR